MMLLNYYTEAALRLEDCPEVLRHSIRVSGLARKLAEKMGSKDPDVFAIAGIMHDLGKLQWPEELHEKKGLSQDEWATIHRHPIPSGEIAKEIWPNIPNQIMIMILNHHERPDGKGTPNGFNNTEIPVLTLAVADQYDALTRKRSYRGFVFTPDQAIEELLRWAPLRIINALADITGVDNSEVLFTKEAKAVSESKIDTKVPSQILGNVCPFVRTSYADKSQGPINLCKNKYRINQAYASEFCVTKSFHRCTDYMRYIAMDLSEKFKMI